MNYLDMINEINKIINAIESTGAKVVRIPCDLDIDKVHVTKLGEELLAYRRIRSIATTDIEDVNWTIAIKCLNEDVCCIYNLIKDNKLKYPKELEEFIENCNAIYEQWDNVYREAFNSIKDYHNNRKTEKSIDDMNAEELREYIKTHKL